MDVDHHKLKRKIIPEIASKAKLVIEIARTGDYQSKRANENENRFATTIAIIQFWQICDLIRRLLL